MIKVSPTTTSNTSSANVAPLAAADKHMTSRAKNRKSAIPAQPNKTNPYLDGFQAVTSAIGKLALDEVSGSTRKIPTNSNQLEKYLSSELGGSWNVLQRTDTDGCMGAYYSAASESDDRRVFIKLARPAISERIIDAALGLGKIEAAGYLNLPQNGETNLGSCLIPRCQVATASKHGSRYAIVLDELDAARTHLVKPGEYLPVDKVRTALLALAGMHAKFWGKEGAVPRINREISAKFVNLAIASAVPKAKEDGLIPSGGVEDRIVVAAEKLGGITGLDAVLNGLHPDLRTLVHGDAHGGNLFFAKSEDGEQDQAGLLDWQCYSYGNPIIDVASILVNTLSTEDFVNYSDSLIVDYIDALNEKCGNKTTISKEQIMDGIQLKAGYYMVGCLLVLGLPGAPGDESKKELCRNAWQHYLEIAEQIDMADALEGFARG